MKRLLYLAVLCLLAAGCTPKKEAVSAEQNDPATPGAETPVEPGKPTPSNPTTPADAPVVSQLPSELKHEGYEYYGLGYSEPVDLEVKSVSNDRVLTGSMTTKLISFEDGKAVFRRERTGSLEDLGVDEYWLEKDGIYVKSSTLAKTNGHQLEIPAKLTPGTTWSDDTEIEMQGQALKMKNNYKVVGVEKVKTKKGTFDALLITAKGKGVMGGRNVTMESKSWYAKGIGNVKTEIKTTDAGGQAQTVVYQVVGK